MRRLLAVTALATVAAAAPAAAFNIDRRIIPQPVVKYYVALPDWKKPMKRAVKAVNREHVGVRLVLAKVPEQASIQVGRFDRQCGLAGVDATTQSLVGGYAAIYLPYNCHGQHASIIASHELGHALGLKHEDGLCALMNSSGTGPNGIPTQCLGQSHPWLKRPFRPDDIAGLKQLYRNTPPKLAFGLTGPSTVAAGSPVTFKIKATDREKNLSEIRIDYGDGSAGDTAIVGEDPPAFHSYGAPGTYRITVTALDFYLKKATKSVTVTVT